MWNQMPAKSLRQQAFAPRSGLFSGSRAARKSWHCQGCLKSPTDFFDSLRAGTPALFFYFSSISACHVILNFHLHNKELSFIMYE
ncbi:hypothetical protein, partial [Dysosmobacter sp.]|uniref:hypothetical protein n=1 Tax=Dysosmobacter sp. TaxID=2591382 RepID=UPI002A876DC4